MKKFCLNFLAIFCLLISSNLIFAQSPCQDVNVEVVPQDPQMGSNNYFGIKISIASAHSSDITVSGTIKDEEYPENSQAFSLTINAGLTEEQTQSNFFAASPVSQAVITVNSVTNCPSNSTSAIYDQFDQMFNNIGSFHNLFLENAYSINTSGTNYEDAINTIRDYSKSIFFLNENSYFGSVESTTEMNAMFELVKYWANQEVFLQKALSTNDPFSIDSAVIKMNAMNIIDASNKSILSNIAVAVESNLSGTLSNENFEQTIVNLATDWLQVNNGNEQSISASMSGNVLAISLKSLEWWRENASQLYDPAALAYEPNQFNNFDAYSLSGPNAGGIENKSMFLPLPVGLDVAGAFIGTFLSAGNQYYDTGTVDMRKVYRGAAIGAVTGSVGAVGRLGRWISSVF